MFISFQHLPLYNWIYNFLSKQKPISIAYQIFAVLMLNEMRIKQTHRKQTKEIPNFQYKTFKTKRDHEYKVNM